MAKTEGRRARRRKDRKALGTPTHPFDELLWRWLTWEPSEQRWEPSQNRIYQVAVPAFGGLLGLVGFALSDVPVGVVVAAVVGFVLLGLFITFVPKWTRDKRVRARTYGELSQRSSGAQYAGLRVALPIAPASGKPDTDPIEQDDERMVELKRAGGGDYTLIDNDDILVKVVDDTVEESIRKDKTGKLRILAVSGTSLIGHANDPGLLYADVLAWPGPVEVLLLDPACSWAESRGLNLGRGSARYRSDMLREVIELLDVVAGDRGEVTTEIRFYEDRPIWKLVFTRYRMLLFSAVHPVRGAVLERQSPLYVIERTARARHFGLHHGFDAVWERRWQKAKRLVDLRLGAVELNLDESETKALENLAGCSTVFDLPEHESVGVESEVEDDDDEGDWRENAAYR